jgi:hypothetical protein
MRGRLTLLPTTPGAKDDVFGCCLLDDFACREHVLFSF